MAEQDLLERAKGEIRERLEELYPLVEERDRLRAALEALEAGEGPERASRRASRQRVRPTTSRRAGRGERRTQLLELLRPRATPCWLAAEQSPAGVETRIMRRPCESPGMS